MGLGSRLGLIRVMVGLRVRIGVRVKIWVKVKVRKIWVRVEG